MHNGEIQPTRKTGSGGRSAEVNGGQARKPIAPGRPAAAREESRRPWAVRKPDSPSWVERVDQF